ncbi:MAG TPA: TfoX/Sxy family protein [Gaiellaceae bacterium]|nr:TfoX/Sxy family protein [Gaiellaceae bacterium]
MAYDEGLAERIRSATADRGGVTEKKMFGGLAFLLDGHMFCGIVGDELMVRVGEDRAASVLQEAHTRPMDFTGRPLKGYVYVTPEGTATDPDLRAWVDAGAEFAATLPPK